MSGTFTLPTGWSWITVDELASVVQYGSSAKTNEDSSGVPVLRMGNIVAGRLDTTELKYLPSTHEEFPNLLLSPGDLLFNRTNSAELVGKTAVYTGSPNPCSFASYLIRVRLKSACLSSFLSGYINSTFGREWIASVVNQQVGQANVNGSKLRALRVPLPPLAEQRRIVVAVEQHLSDIDAGVTTLERVLLNLKRYRASVLKAACEGRLVPTEAELARKEGRAYEPGEVLLGRVLAERRVRWEASRKGRYVEPAQPSMDDLPLLPEGWTWVRIEQCAIEPLCNGLSVKGAAEPPGVPALRLSAMSDGGFDYSDVRYLPVTWSDVDDLAIVTGDFFVSRGNGSLHLVGRGTEAQSPPTRIIFPDTMIRLRMAEALRESHWVARTWSAVGVRAQVERKAKTTAGIYKISQSDLASVTIPLPPLAEQHRIIAEVDRLLSVADETESAVRAQLARAERLRQAVLSRAFEGKLVPQDPDDEPASVMLDRIRSERARMEQGKSMAKRAGRGGGRLRVEALAGDDGDG